MARHAQRRGVDQQRLVSQRVVAAVPVDDRQPRQFRGQCVGAGAGAVGDRHPHPSVQQHRGDGARRPAGAQDQRRPGGRIDAVGAQVLQKAPAIGVAAA